jgi:hypothetical protein
VGTWALPNTSKRGEVLQGTHSEYPPQSQIGHPTSLTKMLCLHTRLLFSKNFAGTTQFRSTQKDLLHKALADAEIEVNGIQDLFVVNNNGFVFYQQSTSLSNQVEWNSQIEVNMLPTTKSTFYVCSSTVLIQIY